MIYFNNKPIQITSTKPISNNDGSYTYTFRLIDFTNYQEKPITEQFKTFIQTYEKTLEDII